MEHAENIATYGSAGRTFWYSFQALLRGCVHVLDEQDLVSDLAVDQLVYGASRQKKTESSRPHSLFFAMRNVGRRIICRVCDRCMGHRFAFEACAGVTHIKYKSSSSANGGDLHHLFGIKCRPVLHRVEENLSQGQH